MDEEDPNLGGEEDEEGGEDEPFDIDEIDLEALAEALYALLRQELRLERERQGKVGVWRV